MTYVSTVEMCSWSITTHVTGPFSALNYLTADFVETPLILYFLSVLNASVMIRDTKVKKLYTKKSYRPEHSVGDEYVE